MVGEILFQIGSLKVYTHGTGLVLGVIFSSFVLYKLANKNGLNKAVIFDLIIYSLFTGIIGARIAYFILYRSQFENVAGIAKIWEGGLVSFGGFILGIITAIIVLKIYKEKILPWLDLLLISSLIGMAIGRMGSFLSGELAGLPSSGATAILGVHPITLYESIFNLLIFIILAVLYLKFSKTAESGIFSLNVVMLYSLGRFIIDFWRDEETMALGLSLGQIFSGAVLIISLLLFIYIIFKNRRTLHAIPKFD